ncbi:MAG: beta-propeller domains of methanol dehydrogenase type [Inoviridae sp.]|nr:MAG: beta-propeller domains of methanol dehydrogenase type [Inoviridae sp.]
MKNLIIFLSTFTLTVLLAVFMSTPANAGGAGGSWGCPDGWTTNSDGTCSFGGGGGSTGGGGAGGSWGESCSASIKYSGVPTTSYSSPTAACSSLVGRRVSNYVFTAGAYVGGNVCSYSVKFDNGNKADFPGAPMLVLSNCNSEPEPEPEPEPDVPPEFPPPLPPSDDCNVCQSLYEIKLKINHLKNQDINNITNIVNNMSTTINNIDNSINALSVNQQVINNNLTTINNNMGDLITNIENNNITNNEIKNIVNEIDNSMTDYSLKLGDIELALGDIDVKLDNTNKLVLDLRPDIEFIKNNLVNGSPEGNDYTEQLNQIIDLLKPCEPTAEKPCPNDDEVVKKLKEIQDYMEADFVPDTDSTAVEVEDLTNIELDRNLIKFGVASCPPDNEFNTIVNGFSFSGGFKHKPLCDFFTMLAPFIKAFGGFSAALVLGGGLRR